MQRLTFRSYFFLISLSPFVAIFCSTETTAQDIHFSQFNHSPFNLNPGLAGNFDWDENLTFDMQNNKSQKYLLHNYGWEKLGRVVGNQRTQWRSVTVPYSTWGISGDGFWIDNLPKLATGISIYHDKTGDSQLSTTIVNLVGAWRMYMDDSRKRTFTPGLELGITSQRIDYSSLQYDNQWNGYQYDPSINSNENYPRDARTHLNVHVGAVYFERYTDRKTLEVGVSGYNLLPARRSWFDDSSVKLDARINVHITYNQPLSNDLDITPAILYMSQGTFQEFDLGGTASYFIDGADQSHNTVFAGMFFRTRDAGFVVAGMKYYQWTAGISYDINLSDLKPASNSRGGFEFSVIYIFGKARSVSMGLRKCPDWM